MTSEKLMEIYKRLYEYFGPQNWWPGESQFEIIVGAILTQNTNWKNVEKAIANLRAAGCLCPEKLNELSEGRLAEMIRPAGYFNIKARRLKNFMKWLFDNYDGKLSNIEGVSNDRLREELLSIKGVGPETADSIMLYAFERDVFVVDAYTARVMVRHHLIEPETDYEGLRGLFESNLEHNAGFFNEYHALLVRVGKEFCRPTARCEGCPLEELPHTLEFEF